MKQINMRLIPKAEIEACAGMKVSDVAEKLKVSQSKLRRLIVAYKLRPLFYMPNGPKIPKQYYLDNQHLTIAQLADDKDVHHATIRNHLQHYEIDHLFITTETKRKKPKVVNYGFETYHRPVRYPCMREGCNNRFKKDISTDVSDEKAARMRFMCSDCSGRSGTETVYSYSGQGES